MTLAFNEFKIFYLIEVYNLFITMHPPLVNTVISGMVHTILNW
jgi:hypothetical protein